MTSLQISADAQSTTRSSGEGVFDAAPLRIDWNKHDLAEAYDLIEGVRKQAAQDPDSPLDTSLRDALDAVEAADCEWDGLTLPEGARYLGQRGGQVIDALATTPSPDASPDSGWDWELPPLNAEQLAEIHEIARVEQERRRDACPPSPAIVKEAGEGERLREVLEEQMEAQDEHLPSSMARERGLVWLEGWFDLAAALSASNAAQEAK